MEFTTKTIFRRISLAVVLVGLAYSIPYLLQVANHLGLHIRRIDHFPGPCKVLKGISNGSEDITVTSNGLAFITSGMRSFLLGKPKDVKGNIYMYDFKQPSHNITKLKIISNTIDFETFEPHGIGMFENKRRSEIILFVIDHSETVDVVRIFSFKQGQKTLHHIETVKDASFRCLNNVAAIGPNQFYVTNYAYHCKSHIVLRTIEEALAPLFLRTSVVFFDGMHGRIVANKLKVANGISLSADKTLVYVTSTFGRQLIIYKRNISSHSLEKIKVVPLKSYPDNVVVDSNTGDLYIGTHPYLLPLFLRDNSGKRPAPANILKLTSTDDTWQSYKLSELLYSSGKNFVQGASAAAFYNGKLLVGSIHHKLGFCRVQRY